MAGAVNAAGVLASSKFTTSIHAAVWEMILSKIWSLSAPVATKSCTHTGDGSKTRDYVYIDDIVTANLQVLDREVCGVFNLGWGKEVTDLKVFHTVCETIGTSIEPIFDQKRPGEIDRICLDGRRARDVFGWKARVNFTEGVKRAVEYWKQQLSLTR